METNSHLVSMAAETPVAKYGNITFPNTPLERHFHFLKPEKYCILLVIQSTGSPYLFIFHICNITREYVEYGSEIMHRLCYNSGRPKVISLKLWYAGVTLCDSPSAKFVAYYNMFYHMSNSLYSISSLSLTYCLLL